MTRRRITRSRRTSGVAVGLFAVECVEKGSSELLLQLGFALRSNL